MERIAVLIASSPTSESARGAFRLIRELTAQGHAVALALLEDGVLAATGKLPEAPLEGVAEVLVLGEDLKLRGLEVSELHSACRVADHGDVVDLVMERSDKALGMF